MDWVKVEYNGKKYLGEVHILFRQSTDDYLDKTWTLPKIC